MPRMECFHEPPHLGEVHPQRPHGSTAWIVARAGRSIFFTWFEYAGEDATVFDKLVGALRNPVERTYVEREVDIGLVRCTADVAYIPLAPLV